MKQFDLILDLKRPAAVPPPVATKPDAPRPPVRVAPVEVPKSTPRGTGKK